MATNVTTTTCSGCSEGVRVDVDGGTATVRVPSNGKRGALHVPAHNLVADVWVDGDLAMWDCPIESCGYADSVYATAALRKALA